MAAQKPGIVKYQQVGVGNDAPREGLEAVLSGGEMAVAHQPARPPHLRGVGAVARQRIGLPYGVAVMTGRRGIQGRRLHPEMRHPAGRTAAAALGVRGKQGLERALQEFRPTVLFRLVHAAAVARGGRRALARVKVVVNQNIAGNDEMAGRGWRRHVDRSALVLDRPVAMIEQPFGILGQCLAAELAHQRLELAIVRRRAGARRLAPARSKMRPISA